MVIISALLTAKPGREDELEALARAMVENVRPEPGALEYTLHRGAQNPRLIYFHERYADQAACDAHMATPYLAEFLNAAAALLEAPAQVHTFREVARIPLKDAASRA